MRVFLDTNVIVSATATRGLCADLFREVLLSHELVVSEPLLEEVSRVLRTKFGITDDMVEAVTRLLRQDTIFSQPTEPLNLPIQDRDDLAILAGAIAGGADVFVTGDKELLTLGSVQDLEIISPRRLWEKIVSRETPEKP
jgi:putative PIN family toxin of toxin-antitoxin system